jgi:hypothetical protein
MEKISLFLTHAKKKLFYVLFWFLIAYFFILFFLMGVCLPVMNKINEYRVEYSIKSLQQLSAFIEENGVDGLKNNNYKVEIEQYKEFFSSTFGCSQICITKTEENFVSDQTNLKGCEFVLSESMVKYEKNGWGGYVVSPSGKIRFNVPLFGGNLNYIFQDFTPFQNIELLQQWTFFKAIPKRGKLQNPTIFWSDIITQDKK